MKSLKKLWEQEKGAIILLLLIIFLAFNLVRATNTIAELKEENADLWYMVDHYTPTAEEND